MKRLKEQKEIQTTTMTMGDSRKTTPKSTQEDDKMPSTLNLDLHLPEVDEERAKLNQEYHQYMKLSKHNANLRAELEENIKRYERLKKEINEELDKEYKEFTKESKDKLKSHIETAKIENKKKLQSQIAHIEKLTDQEVKDFQQALHMNKEDSLQRIEEENQIKVKKAEKKSQRNLANYLGKLKEKYLKKAAILKRQLEKENLKFIQKIKNEQEHLVEIERQTLIKRAKENLRALEQSLRVEHEEKILKLKAKFDKEYQNQESQEDADRQACWEKELEILNSKEDSLKDWWPKPLKGRGEPHLPTQDEYIETLKERDINPNAQRYLSKIHAWIAKRRDLSLPAVINPHLNHYYKLYNRGAPDTSKQDLQSPSPSENRIQTRREEFIQT